MEKITRFGVSLPDELLKKFDKLIYSKKYVNRSEAIRDLIRKELIAEEIKTGKKVTGAVILVYEHHKRELINIIMEIQHKYSGIIVSTQHIHLDRDNCLEIVAVKGKSQSIKAFSDSLRSLKGVKQTEVTLTTTGKGIV